MKDYTEEDNVGTVFAEEGFFSRPDLQGQIVQPRFASFASDNVDGLGVHVYAVNPAIWSHEFSGWNCEEAFTTTDVDER
jgi:hypothetical protein